MNMLHCEVSYPYVNHIFMVRFVTRVLVLRFRLKSRTLMLYFIFLFFFSKSTCADLNQYKR